MSVSVAANAGVASTNAPAAMATATGTDAADTDITDMRSVRPFLSPVHVAGGIGGSGPQAAVKKEE